MNTLSAASDKPISNRFLNRLISDSQTASSLRESLTNKQTINEIRRFFPRKDSKENSYKILSAHLFLAYNGKGSASAKQISQLLNREHKRTAHHQKALTRVGLLTRHHDGTFEATPKVITRMFEIIEQRAQKSSAVNRAIVKQA